MTTINTPDHPYEQNKLNKLDFCECGVAKRLHTTDFIKSQKELASKLPFYGSEVDKEGASHNALVHVDDVKKLITKIIQNTGEEIMRLAEGERVEPTESYAGYMTGLTKSGERLTHNQRVGYNQALDTLKKHITSLTGVGEIEDETPAFECNSCGFGKPCSRHITGVTGEE